MARALRIVLIGAGSLIALLGIALAAAWALLPREKIEAEAKRQAGLAAGAAIEWKSLEPGFEWLSLGVRLRDFSARMPVEGPPAVDARVGEIFVRFRLLPLLFRKVEVSAASIRHARVTLVDRGAPPPAPPGGKGGGGGMSVALPRLDLEDISVSSRDPFGGGFDLKGIHGHTSISGALPAVTGAGVDVEAESLFWKPSAKDPLVALPGPAKLDIVLAGRDRGARLE